MSERKLSTETVERLRKARTYKEAVSIYIPRPQDRMNKVVLANMDQAEGAAWQSWRRMQKAGKVSVGILDYIMLLILLRGHMFDSAQKPPKVA